LRKSQKNAIFVAEDAFGGPEMVKPAQDSEALLVEIERLGLML
jgi:hypothetical protein